ncbi:VP1 [Sedum sarmentosum microvirus]|nr:VP1 [Sedum sarmentosum microvirus]
MNKQTLRVNDVDWSTFDLSHINRTSFDMGNLVPLACLPTLPRDQFEITVSNFTRLVPTKVPMLDGLDLKINHFYIPYRCLWNGFEQFISLASNKRVQTKSLPLVTLGATAGQGNYPNGRLADYLGLNLEINDYAQVSAMPFLAYHKIYLDHYAPKRWVNYLNADGTSTELSDLRDILEAIRDGNGGASIDDITATSNLGKMRQVNWNHDYFTNALPTPTLFSDQKLPLFTNSNTIGDELDLNLRGNEGEYYVTGDTVTFSESGNDAAVANQKLRATIRDLRTSISLQHYLEKLQQANGGYLETMKIHWNQDLPNDLLQRSEYLGGDVTTIFHNEVESTADTKSGDTGQGLGDLAGKPVGGGTSDKIDMYSDEFGVYMCIAHVMPKRSYANAINRMWLDTTPTEFPNPDFENIGDQAIQKYELTGQWNEQAIWGWVPRYSQYKTALDRFSGEMRHSLKDWHFGSFKSELQPFNTISPQFMEANPRVDMFQVPGEPDKILGTFKFDIKAKRPLQNTSQPGIGYI